MASGRSPGPFQGGHFPREVAPPKQGGTPRLNSPSAQSCSYTRAPGGASALGAESQQAPGGGASGAARGPPGPLPGLPFLHPYPTTPREALPPLQRPADLPTEQPPPAPKRGGFPSSRFAVPPEEQGLPQLRHFPGGVQSLTQARDAVAAMPPSGMKKLFARMYGEATSSNNVEWLRHKLMQGLGLPSKKQLSTRQRLARKAEEAGRLQGRPDASASKKAVGPVSPLAMLRGQLLAGPQQQQQPAEAAAPPLTWRERQRSQLQQQQQQPDCDGADALLAAAAVMEGAQRAEPPARAPRGLALPCTLQEPRWEQQLWDCGYASSSMAAVPSRHGSAGPYFYHNPGLAQAGGFAMASHASFSPPPPYTPGYYGGLNAYLLGAAAPQALHPPVGAAPQPQLFPASWSLPLGGWEAGHGLPHAPGIMDPLQGYGLAGQHWLG